MAEEFSFDIDDNIKIFLAIGNHFDESQFRTIVGELGFIPAYIWSGHASYRDE